MLVERLIELVDVVTVNFENILFSLHGQFKQLNVVRQLGEVLFVLVNLVEGLEEVLDLHLHITLIDIGSPNHLLVA